mgnify:CR=1 FL=1
MLVRLYKDEANLFSKSNRGQRTYKKVSGQRVSTPKFMIKRWEDVINKYGHLHGIQLDDIKIQQPK